MRETARRVADEEGTVCVGEEGSWRGASVIFFSVYLKQRDVSFEHLPLFGVYRVLSVERSLPHHPGRDCLVSSRNFSGGELTLKSAQKLQRATVMNQTNILELSTLSRGWLG